MTTARATHPMHRTIYKPHVTECWTRLNRVHRPATDHYCRIQYVPRIDIYVNLEMKNDGQMQIKREFF